MTAMLRNSSVNVTAEEMERRIAMAIKSYNDTLAFEALIGTLIPSVFGLIIIIGLLGNLLVICVLGLNKSMRNSTNTLILSLALSDLMFLTLCVPFSAADYALSWWPFFDWWCGALNYLQFVSAYASVWTLVLMAGDRFLAVVFPVRSMAWRTARNTGLLVGLLWAFILAVCAPIAFQYAIIRYPYYGEQRSTCAFLKEATRTGSPGEIRLFYFSFNVMGYLLPLGIASLLYCVFLRRLWGMSRPGNSSSRRAVKEESIRAKKKVTWMVSGVILTFAFCWLPLNVCFALTGLVYPDRYMSQIFIVLQISSQVLAYANSCLNPILYAFLSDNFRRGFKKILAPLCMRRGKLMKELRSGRGELGSFCQTTVPSAKSSLAPSSTARSGLLSVPSNPAFENGAPQAPASASPSRRWASPLQKRLRRKSGVSLTLSLDRMGRQRSCASSTRLSKALVPPEEEREIKV